ncbi:MAG: SRPBCC family protein, partial [Bacteroidia bacterium]
MNAAVLFNFLVDKENKKIRVERSFNAPLDLVWAAWTEPEILDQWWAPKPWRAETKSMDFRVGGRWLYCMAGPEGERHWCLFDYKTIIR